MHGFVYGIIKPTSDISDLREILAFGSMVARGQYDFVLLVNIDSPMDLRMTASQDE